MIHGALGPWTRTQKMSYGKDRNKRKYTDKTQNMTAIARVNRAGGLFQGMGANERLVAHEVILSSRHLFPPIGRLCGK